MVLADFTFGQALLTVLEIFVFAAWLSGWGKAAWIIFLIFVPFLGTLIYPIARGQGMRDRALAEQQEAQKQIDAYVRETAGGGSAADELTKLAKLHDEHKLSDEEFERAKAKIVA